jgi:micrococcal nuclease
MSDSQVSRRLKVAIAILAAFVISSLYTELSRLQLPNFSAFLETAQPGTYTVTSVMDGDTIEVDLGGYKDTVRLIGVDTPETKDPRKPLQCYGEAASAKTAEWSLGKRVRLEADPADSERDKYGRLLRYVYLEDSRLLNAEIIKEGYGFAYTIFPFEKLEEFRSYEHEARAAGRGLWSGCSIDENREVKQTNPK